MTTGLFQAEGKSVEDLRTERANRAVRAFKAMQPGLNGYARAITGRRDIEVVIDKGVTRTDGKKIYFRPPIELGDLAPHQREDCDRRDPENLKQICPACRIRETILIQIYHEIAHNLHGTFEEVSDHAKANIYDRALEASGTKYAEKLKRLWDDIPDYKKHDYINLSSLVSPFLPVLVNAIEDARVDESMFRARKGTRVMFTALTEGIFREGIEGDNGEVFRWSERPLNSQILIGVFVLACGYKYEGWFAPEVEEAMGDGYLRSLVARVDTLRSAEGSYGLAFPILERLRELGFCKTDEDPEEDPEDQKEEEQQDGDSEESQDEEDQDESGSTDAASGGEDRPEDSEPGDSDDPDKGADSGEPEEGGDDDEESSGSGAGDDEDEPGADGESDGDADSGSEQDGELDADGDGEGSADSGSEPSEEDGSSGSEGEVDSRESSPDDGDGGSADGGQDSSAEGGSGEPTAAEDQQGSGVSPSGDEGPDSDSHSDDGGDAGDVQGGSALDELIDDEPVDTGADDGDGGKKGGSLDYGTPEQAEYDLKVFSQHEEDEPSEDDASGTAELDNKAVDRAVIQGEYFEKPSTNITGVRIHKWGQPLYAKGYNISHGWAELDDDDDDAFSQRLRRRRGADVDMEIPESVLGPATTEMRRALSDNARAKQERHLRSGKINQKVLGKRAWAGDDRLFQKKRIPGKRSYAVILGIDISGSTWGLNLSLAKRAAMAQAQLCQRVGVDFAIYAHTAGPDYEKGFSYGNGLFVDVYEVKGFDTPWDSSSKEALSRLTSAEENLDGHTIEFYRKQIERHPATDKIILYYTDGKMPAANHDEELEILQREILTCKKQNITLLGVGIRTDSPRRHGLDTVEVESDSDVSKVVRHLQNGLLHNR